MEWTRGRVATTALSVALAGAAIVAVVLALWLLPPWLVDQAGPELEGAELTRAVTEERRNVLAGLVAIGAALTLWYTHQRQELDRDANRTDRYTKAVEQLGDDTKPSVQLGGIYALERVAKDSRRDREVSFKVLSAFVRQQSKAHAEGADAAVDDQGADSEYPASDLAGKAPNSEPVLAALAVLGRRPLGDRTYPPPDLSGAHLSDVPLSRANLTGASMTGADLTHADLSEADMADAKLGDANLASASLTYADLTRAWLIDVDLVEADLGEADLTGARLARANLARAKLDAAKLTGSLLYRTNLTGADLTGADLTDASLIQSDLTNADLTNAKLTRAKLTDANLTGAKLTDANLTGADLARADLTGANLTGANLTGADLAGVHHDDATTWPDGFPPPPS
jgi:uncharacterized protein YjbI with pentapeptide repeats